MLLPRVSIALCCLCISAAPTTQPPAPQDDAPSVLLLPAEGVTLTVNLNDSVVVPGSRGKLTLSLKSADHGTQGSEPTVALTSPTCVCVPTAPARAGDEHLFHVDGRDYVLRIEKVVTMTLADDYAVATLLDRPAAQRQHVERGLKRIEQSDLVFFLDDRECTGAEMAKHLREQIEILSGDAVATSQPVISFVSLLRGENPISATQPATASTEPADSASAPLPQRLPPPSPGPPPLPRCRVRTHDGQIIDLATWLGESSR